MQSSFRHTSVKPESRNRATAGLSAAIVSHSRVMPFASAVSSSSQKPSPAVPLSSVLSPRRADSRYRPENPNHSGKRFPRRSSLRFPNTDSGTSARAYRPGAIGRTTLPIFLSENRLYRPIFHLYGHGCRIRKQRTAISQFFKRRLVQAQHKLLLSAGDKSVSHRSARAFRHGRR